MGSRPERAAARGDVAVRAEAEGEVGAPEVSVPVVVVLPPRTMFLDLAGPLEVLRRANFEQSAIRFDVQYVAASSSVSTSIGIDLRGIRALPSRLPEKAVLMVIGTVECASEWGGPVDEKDEAEQEAILAEWLRRVVRPTHTVIAICSGALLLGRAGLLDGLRCTTHHLDCAELSRVAPQALVITDRLYVQDGNIYTSAGVTAGIDLMLYFISSYIGHACAVGVARYLVIYLRRAGSDPQVSPWLEGRNHLHPAVHRVQDAIAADPTQPWTRSQLARVAGASGRHLSRLFHEHVGMPIPDYRNRLRVALARELLLQSELDMENIAERAGFSSTRQLRRAWQRLYRTSPSETRASMLPAS